jgi:hypothetical protein
VVRDWLVEEAEGSRQSLVGVRGGIDIQAMGEDHSEAHVVAGREVWWRRSWWSFHRRL